MEYEGEKNLYKESSRIIQKVQRKYGARDWEEFDKIQQEDRQLLSSDNSQDSANKKKKKKPSRKEKKLGEIEQYQKALKRLRTTAQQFHNPFERQKLNLETMPVLNMLEKAHDKEFNLELVLKKMGLKTAKILFKSGARVNIKFMLIYLKDGIIPNWIISRHRDMMKKKDDQFNSDQNTLLRTMSNNNSNCFQHPWKT